MSTAVLPTHVTVEEFLTRPERQDGFFEELVEGVVYVCPNVKPRHNEIVARLERELLPLEERGFVVRGEVACRLTTESLPNTDASVFSRAIWEAQNLDEFFQVPPALAIEVHSPSNRQLQRKASLYLEHGAEQVWIVYPKARRIHVLTPDGEGDRDAREDEHVEFHGIRIAVSEILP